MTSEQLGSGLAPIPTSSTLKLNETQKEELVGLFENFYNESSGGNRMKMSTISAANPLIEVNPQEDIPSPVSGSSTTTYEDADSVPDTPPIISIQQELSSNNTTPTSNKNVDDQEITHASSEEEPFIKPFATPKTEVGVPFETRYVDPSNMHMFYQPHPYKRRLTQVHPLEQMIGNPSQPVQARNATPDYYFYSSFLSQEEPANVKEALADTEWIITMQEEVNIFIRHDIWRKVP